MKGDQIKWKFHEVLMESDHCVSVALDNQTAEKIPFRNITFEELMENCTPLLMEDESFVANFFKKLDK